MYMIIGLGNPGARYENTRHNIGFMVINEFAKIIGVERTWEEDNAFMRLATMNGNEVVLVQPLTFMNDSGMILPRIMEVFTVQLHEMMVVLDDINLPLGSLRIRQGGSAGGHRGLASVIYHLLTDQFPRMRLGVGHNPSEENVITYVLDAFNRMEMVTVKDMLDRAAQALGVFVTRGIEPAMNDFNTVPKIETE